VIRAMTLDGAPSVVVADGQPGAGDVVGAAGRVFWRATLGPGTSSVTSYPVDGIGGATVVETTASSPPALATDGCSLFYVAGVDLIRRGL
jgi:hypothetical protein